MYGTTSSDTGTGRTGANSEHHVAEAFNERNRKPLTAGDIRFTKKGDVVYAFSMGWPERQLTVDALGTRAGAGKIRSVQLLGHSGPVKWTQGDGALTVALPAEKPSDHAVVFKVIGA
jgi:alpha-L-fucosidase